MTPHPWDADGKLVHPAQRAKRFAHLGAVGDTPYDVDPGEVIPLFCMR